MSVLAYCLDSEVSLLAAPPLAQDYTEEFWRPRPPRLLPPGLRSLHFMIYTLMHYLGLFGNDEYAVYLIRCGNAVVHRSCVNPPDFRFPFMRRDDLQIGNVATAEAHRGRGLAAHAIATIVRRYATEGRTFWYIAEEENRASIRAAEKVGFIVRGVVEKRPRLGMAFLGSYDYKPLP